MIFMKQVYLSTTGLFHYFIEGKPFLNEKDEWGNHSFLFPIDLIVEAFSNGFYFLFVL